MIRRLAIAAWILYSLQVSQAKPMGGEDPQPGEPRIQPDGKNLKQMLKLFAVVDSVSNLENYLESNGNDPYKPASTGIRHNLKWEHIDLASEFFQSIDGRLRQQMKVNLPRLGSFDEVLRRNANDYMRLRNTQSPIGEREPYAKFLTHLANEYRQTLWLRYKGVPELNPVPGSQVGELLNYFAGCSSKNYTNPEELNELIKSAEAEYLSEMEKLVADVTGGPANGEPADDYQILYRIEDYFLQLVVRILKDQIFEPASQLETSGSGSARNLVSAESMKSKFVSALRDFGFVIESCLRLKRIA